MVSMGFMSKGLDLIERNYAIHEKELLSVICSLEEWQQILEGTKHMIEILNDHRNLVYFWTSQDLNCWQACWSLWLARFDFCLVHRPGRHSMKPDALSCWADLWTGDEDNQDQVMLLAENFKAEPSQAKPNQTEPSQSIAADGDGPSQVTLEGEGTEFLERVHNCTDREDAVVRALKELNTGKGLHHEEW